jgi:ubiquinone/menaquinone biosynthesis C-methylase UbiE
MNLDLDTNRVAYETPQVVAKYEIASLQNAEAIAFVKYAEEFRNRRVLDIGCGGGRTTWFLREFTDHYVGIDYSEGMVNACRKRFPGGVFHHCDVRDLSRFESGEFDTVLFSFNGLDYISHPDRLKALAEIHRVLGKSGFFLFSTHNRLSSDRLTRPSLRFFRNPFALLRSLKRFRTEMRNLKGMEKHEVKTDHYEMICDSFLSYSMLTYYISPGEQVKQSNNAGFSVTDVWASDGAQLLPPDYGSNAPWIYYACRKQ